VTHQLTPEQAQALERAIDCSCYLIDQVSRKKGLTLEEARHAAEAIAACVCTCEAASRLLGEQQPKPKTVGKLEYPER
jgi:hypothetical protein